MSECGTSAALSELGELTERDMVEMTGATELPADARALMRSYGWGYVRLGREERDAALLGILQALERGWPKAGERGRWDEGWPVALEGLAGVLGHRLHQLFFVAPLRHLDIDPAAAAFLQPLLNDRPVLDRVLEEEQGRYV